MEKIVESLEAVVGYLTTAQYISLLRNIRSRCLEMFCKSSVI